ncbi:MAG: 3-keto-5-aminohexanoate cleavage protein [Caldilineaceae bacterium]|nr:3-keto-5-aminohexanoate cleavage protein [Caldilineaceae bacterium]MDE0464403.1 3-keto-5-aminohexanoate cleavage protein [Caldilineaceae bacterium]
MDITWDYTSQREYVRRISGGMPPVIISAVVTGGHQKSENPAVPVTAEEQADAAAEVFAAGATIIHIHARQAEDPTQASHEADRYREINAMMRAKAPQILVDNSQGFADLSTAGSSFVGTAHHYKSAPIEAGPDIMAFNPGPMTFRGGAAYTGGDGGPSKVTLATFDDSERTAHRLRERGIKPQVFLYHPGHLDILDYLIQRDALDKPYFLQLVFGQESGINTSMDSFLYMVRNLPEDSLFQTCALGLEELHVNVMAMLLGGHVRTGLEDCIHYQCGELARSNAQMVERIARIANDLGRGVATIEETRRMLGIDR